MLPIPSTGPGLNPLYAVAQATTSPTTATDLSGNVGQPFEDFGTFLGKAIDTINSTQADADTAATDLVTGKTTDLHTVMIAMQKAKVTFDLAVQVRNKALDAYNDLMRTQV